MTKKSDYDKYFEKTKYRFFINQLLETGLPPSLNKFKYTRDGQTGTAWYMSPDDEGNVRFYVPDILTSDLEIYTYGQPPHQKIRDWYLTRWKTPKETKAGPAKYTPVKGAGTRCLFTPPVVDAFHAGKKIDTLFVVEGFKKAISGWVAGNLPIAGVNGLTGFKAPGENNDKLRKEFRDVIQKCKVQNVVIIYDSDLFDLSLASKVETKRPNQFYRAALTAKTLFEPFADVYLTYPNPHPEKKYGLDDLLLEHRNFSSINSKLDVDYPGIKVQDGQKKIIADLLQCVKKNEHGKYFSIHKLSSHADYKIKKLFHLDNVQSFYDFYRDKLIRKPNKRFRFYTYTYQVQADGTIGQVENDAAFNIRIENHFGKLVKWTDKGKKELANFTLRVLFQIDSEEDPKRICEITNYEGVSRIVEISSKTFVSLADFQALMISHGDFIWKGSKDDLLDLMTILFRHERPATLVSQLGWQPLDKFYAFSNGIVTGNGFQAVDEYGMVTYNERNFYFPAWSKFNARDYDTYKDLKKFSHFTAKKPVQFSTWKHQFSKVYGKNGEIAISFYISALFSDIIYSHRSGIGFPILWSAGKPQTGKSTICESLLSMFGEKSDAIGLAGKSTIKYFINRFAQVRNAIVHLDEYSNTKVNKDVKETIKNIYDRIGYGRKAFSNDFRTISTPILSAAMVSGEEIPTDNHALFTRSILLLFNRDKFSKEERAEMRKLKDMEADGLTHITIELLRHRQLIEDNFDDSYNEVFNEFYKKFKTKKVEDRILKNCSWMVTPVKILIDNRKIDSIISYNDLLAVFFDNIDRQSSYMQANTDLAKFWDIIEMLYARHEILENKGDFRFVDDTLAIRLNRFHHYYALEARRLGYEKILDKSTLENYLSNEPYFVELLDAKGKKKQIRFKGTSPIPAMFFKYESLGIDLKSDPAKDDSNEEYEGQEEQQDEIEKELPF